MEMLTILIMESWKVSYEGRSDRYISRCCVQTTYGCQFRSWESCQGMERQAIYVAEEYKQYGKTDDLRNDRLGIEDGHD